MCADKLNRFERVAMEIGERHGVHVEWASANREYVVEGRGFSSARRAEAYARDRGREFAAAAGMSTGKRVRS
jgi:hypothetical protein